MVIRSSFVTNSSSSSFVCVSINSKEIVDILMEFEDELQEIFEYGNIYMSGDEFVELYLEEGYADEPRSKNDIIPILAGLFDYCCYEEYCYAVEDGKELDVSKFNEVVRRLMSSKDEIMANLKRFKIINGHSGWQGDDDTRFEEDWYEEDTLQEIKEAIAKEKGCSVEDITSDDFCEYVCDKMNTEECVYEYDGETGKETRFRTTEIC